MKIPSTNIQHPEKHQGESAKGFVSAPTLEQLRPTEQEQHLLKVLWDWQENSKRSRLVLGQPSPNV